MPLGQTEPLPSATASAATTISGSGGMTGARARPGLTSLLLFMQHSGVVRRMFRRASLA